MSAIITERDGGQAQLGHRGVELRIGDRVRLHYDRSNGRHEGWHGFHGRVVCFVNDSYMGHVLDAGVRLDSGGYVETRISSLEPIPCRKYRAPKVLKSLELMPESDIEGARQRFLAKWHAQF